MNALVADAENYLHVGTDNNGKMQGDAQNFNGFPNAGGINDSFYQVILRIKLNLKGVPLLIKAKRACTTILNIKFVIGR